MAKYQLHAANKWGFDFTTESPANNTSNFQWQSTTLSDIPKFYHHIIHNRVNPPVPALSSSLSSSSTSSLELNGKNSEMVMSYFSECENISPLSRNITPMIIVQKPLAVNNRVVPTKVVSIASMSSNQTKITGESLSITTTNTKNTSLLMLNIQLPTFFVLLICR